MDANPSIGFGHIVRCLSIADAVTSFKQEAIFILADDTVQELVNERGYSFIVLGTSYNHLEEETEKSARFLQRTSQEC